MANMNDEKRTKIQIHLVTSISMFESVFESVLESVLDTSAVPKPKKTRTCQ